MPVIRVELLSGRTREQKRQFAEAVTDNFIKLCGGTPDTVHVVFQDVEKSDWAIAGKLMDKATQTAPVSENTDQ